MKIKKILAGIDFGPATDNVIAYVSFFAGAVDASVSLLYVIDYLVTPPAYLGTYIEEEKNAAGNKFEALDRQLAGNGIQTESEVIVGRLQESFEEAIKKKGPDMLALGFMHHALRRSSSEKLIKGLTVPMLVVRGEKAESSRNGQLKIGRIVCPVDFSDISKKALRTAAELSKIFSSKLSVIYVVPTHIIRKNIYEINDIDGLVNKLLEESRDKLDAFVHDIDIKEPCLTEEGEPDKRIVSFSRENDADLIVIGARGLGLIKGMLIGSVTDAVLKSSPCPVLVIH